MAVHSNDWLERILFMFKIQNSWLSRCFIYRFAFWATETVKVIITGDGFQINAQAEQKETSAAYQRRTLRRFKAKHYRTITLLFLSKIRYHFLCFKNFGWLRLVIFILEVPEHFKAVFFALFDHDKSFRYNVHVSNDKVSGAPERPLE